MFLILLSLLFLFSTNSFYAREPETISCTKEIISNDPKNPIVEITTVQMVPDERPIFHLMPGYDQEVTTVLRYTGFDPNNLPEFSEQEIYITPDSSPNSEQPNITRIVTPSEENKKFADDVNRLFKPNNTGFKLDSKTVGYSLLAAGAMSVYGYILWKLYSLSKVVKKKDNWAHWRSEISLEILYDMPEAEVKQSLLKSVNEYYEEQTNAQSIADPILFFQEDLAVEIEKLEKFIRFYRFLDRTLLSVFFPSCYEKAYKIAKNQVDRLYFLEDFVEDVIAKKYFS